MRMLRALKMVYRYFVEHPSTGGIDVIMAEVRDVIETAELQQ